MGKSTLELAVGTGSWDAGLKRATKSLSDFIQSQGGLKQALDQDSEKVRTFVQMMGRMESTSKTLRGQINDYNATIEQLTVQYNRLSDAQKKTIGQDYLKSIEQLKGKYSEAKGSLDDFNKSLGDSGTAFNSVLDVLSKKLGVSGDLMGLVTSKTVMLTGAIGASVTAIMKATEAWTGYNNELAKQDQQTAVVTGLRGGSADNMTDAARSLASVYGVDFRQAIEAANTLMSQFGESGESAMKLLRDGMQGMIQGDGGKLLSMIQQYAPAFQSAGVSASQLVAVIQNSEGGIFTDQNMQAIVMGIKNIRLMTKQTSEALAQLGIDGEAMSKKMSDGSLTVFDALKMVSSKLKDTESGSKTAGEVMQAVFGRQGAMAGTNLAKAIESLNTNLEETKLQTGEIGQATADLQLATERLNKALRDCFEYDGWDTMTTDIKSGLLVALASVVETLGSAKSFLTGIEVAGVNIFDTIREKALNAVGPLGTVLNLLIGISNARSNGRAIQAGGNAGGLLGEVIRNGKGGTGGTETNTDPRDELIAQLRKQLEDALKKGKTDTQTLAPEGSIAAQEQLVANLTKKWKEASDQVGRDGYLKQLDEAKKTLEQMQRVSAPDIDKLYPVQEEPSGPSLSYLDQAKQSIATALSDKAGQIDETAFTSFLTVAIQHGIDGLDLDFTTLQMKMVEGMDIPDSDWTALQDKINEKLGEMELDPIKINLETGNLAGNKELAKDAKNTAQAWQAATNAINSAGSALQNLEDPGAKVAGIVAQAVANIALGFAQATASPATGIAGVFGWIAATTAGLATMVATIASVKSATKGGFASGGIVPGNSFSGDNLRISDYGINSGELILNHAQQNNLANELRGGVGEAVKPQIMLTGDKLYVAINNYLRMAGKGQLVVSQ